METSDSTIVHVLAAHPFGGLEAVVRALAGGLAARAQRVCVAAILDLEPVPHPFEQRLQEDGTRVVPIRLGARAYCEEQRQLATLFERERPAIVHTHGYRADVQASTVARRMGIPVVTTVHGFTGGDLKNRIFEWLQTRALRRSDATVAVSKPLMERLRSAGVPVERLHCLPNAWPGVAEPLARSDARRVLGLQPEAFVAGWIGRLSAEKAPDVFLEALARVHSPRIEGCLVGEGPERTILEARARALGLAERVHFAGAHDDAGRLFPAFDAFVLSSRTEGTPISLFEAMQARLPLVVTRVGGVPDVVSTELAWQVASEDPSAIAQALETIHSDPDRSARRADAAHQRLEAYAPGPWLDAYTKLYRELAEQS